MPLGTSADRHRHSSRCYRPRNRWRCRGDCSSSRSSSDGRLPPQATLRKRHCGDGLAARGCSGSLLREGMPWCKGTTTDNHGPTYPLRHQTRQVLTDAQLREFGEPRVPRRSGRRRRVVPRGCRRRDRPSHRRLAATHRHRRQALLLPASRRTARRPGGTRRIRARSRSPNSSPRPSRSGSSSTTSRSRSTSRRTTTDLAVRTSTATCASIPAKTRPTRSHCSPASS